MSSIDTVITASGKKKYRVRYRTPDGRSRSKVFALKRDADSFADSIGHRKATGEFVDPMAGRITFRNYSETWLERKAAAGKKGTTVNTWRSHMAAHLWPEFGELELRKITRESVKAWAATLTTREKSPLSPTTARAVIHTLSAVLREAVDDGRVHRNVAERIMPGKKRDRRVDPAHIAKVAQAVPRIAAEMPPRWSAAVLLMASTGLRLGECLGLTTDRIEWLGRARTIRVDRQMANTWGGTGFGTTKTPAAVRTIPVPAHVIEMLAEHLARFQAGDDGLLFTMEDGTPVRRSTWSDNYRKACRRAGVAKQTRTHDLRHVTASSLIAGGLSVKAVQAVLGHHSASETLDVYSHFWPSDEERTRTAIESVSATWLSG